MTGHSDHSPAAALLLGKLKGLRQRLLVLSLSASLAITAVSTSLLILVCAWLDVLIELPPFLRIVILICAGLLAAYLFARLGWKGLGLATPTSLARRVDNASANSGQVLSGVDLLVNAHRHGQGVTHGLVEIAVQRADRVCGNTPRSKVVPLREFRRPAYAVLAVLIGLIFTGLAVPRLLSTEWLRFMDPHGDHPPFSRIEFDVEPGDTRIVYGGHADITASTANGVVEDLELVLVDGDGEEFESLPMFPESKERWRSTIVDVTQDMSYFVRARRARSHKHAIDVITVPQLERVSLRVTPPAYTNRPVYVGAVPPNGISGLAGTQVEVSAVSNRPLSAGVMTIGAETSLEQVDMRPADPDTVVGTFTIQHSGPVGVQVIDTAGQLSQDTFNTSITRLEDERPFIRILQPQRQSLATPQARIPVQLAAEDDYGISAIMLYRSLNDSRPLPQRLPVAEPSPLSTNDVLILPLGEYNLLPGDTIELFGRVEDNDPAHSKGYESSITTIRIISQEELQRLMLAKSSMEVLQSKYQQAMRRLERLAQAVEQLQKAIDELPADSELSDALREELATLADQLREAGQDLQTASDYELPFDIDQPFSKALASLSASLKDSSRKLHRLTKRKKLQATEAANTLADIRRQIGKQRGEYASEVTAPLEHLSAIYPLIEDQARFVELYQRQRDLAQRLETVKGLERTADPSTKARMRDLETEEIKLREALSDLLMDIESHATSLPDDPRLNQLRDTANRFVEAVRKSEAQTAMRDAEAGLAEFDGSKGHSGALRAADILEQFLGKCKSMGSQGKMCLTFQPQLSAGLGNTVAQLLASAGLGMGEGGLGSGGGYSASRTTLSNVGLYGSLPAFATAAERGFGASSDGPGAGDSRLSPEGTSKTSTFEAKDLEHALGTGSSYVPIEYRKRVSAYFKRIADEFE